MHGQAPAVPNPRAIAAFAPAAVLAVLLALVPAFAPAAPFAWFIGAGTAAVAYFLLSPPRDRVHEDVPGAEIAVPCAD